MSPVIVAILISGAGLVLSVLYQIWARATAQGNDKAIVLGLQGQVAKLIDWNDDRIRFQAGTTEFIANQKEINGRVSNRLDGHGTDIARMQGRDDRREK